MSDVNGLRLKPDVSAQGGVLPHYYRRSDSTEQTKQPNLCVSRTLKVQGLFIVALVKQNTLVTTDVLVNKCS